MGIDGGSPEVSATCILLQTAGEDVIGNGTGRQVERAAAIRAIAVVGEDDDLVLNLDIEASPRVAVCLATDYP